VEDGLGFAQGAQGRRSHGDELPMGDSEDDGVVRASGWRLGGFLPPLRRSLPREGEG
jgi:hypothetical protein